MQTPTVADQSADTARATLSAGLRFLPQLLIDAILVLAAFGLAMLLRFDGAPPPPYPWRFWQAMPFVIALFTLALTAQGVHEVLWRFAGLADLLRLWYACLVGTAVSLLADVALIREDGIYALPIPVVITGGAIAALLLTASRIWRSVFHLFRAREGAQGAQRVLIVGCGSAGELLARHLVEHRRNNQLPVGFVDDDLSKRGKLVHGVRVLGALADIPHIVEANRVDVVAVSIPSKPEIVRDVVRQCRDVRCKVVNVPALAEIVDGKATVDAFRAVTLEDLLRRDEVQLDQTEWRQHFAGKTILVTGAAGSIGSEICRQLTGFERARVVAFDNNESGLFDLEHQLRRAAPEIDVQVIVGDVTYLDQIESAIRLYQPTILFHCAAYKHVPLMEAYPQQAIRVNVIGTDNVCRAACDRVEQFVLISSDKSVTPSSVMGCTKRLAEQLIADWGERCSTRFCAVRFGNVLGSRGSVVPLFQQQIEAGGPVTVTSAEATRYFMTLNESVQLVLQTAALADSRRLFVLDMGAPVRIVDLAQDLITLSGRRLGADIQVTYTGLRPGEKLHEGLFNPGEPQLETANPKIFATELTAHDVDGLRTFVNDARACLTTWTADSARARLAHLAPDYSHGRDTHD